MLKKVQKSIIFRNNRLWYIDQTKLPLKLVYRECKSIKQGYWAIKKLRVRGAPLIGVFAAYCVYISMKYFKGNKKDKFLKRLDKVINYLKGCRPTAVNLSWSLERMRTRVCANKERKIRELKELILSEARRIHQEDIKLCHKMGRFGAKLIKSGDKILTHCNAGFLATTGDGTALAVIYEANRIYKNIKVYVDETRPLLQGARLTAWELTKRGVRSTLICDNMAAYLLQQGKIDKIIVGADRITRNGDVANKIGTYSLSVLAKYHRIPFYVVAPWNTFDLSIDKGEDIPIEERNREEVVKVLGKVGIAPRRINAYNPAFDVTSHQLVSAIITDEGIIYPPFKKNIKRILNERV